MVSQALQHSVSFENMALVVLFSWFIGFCGLQGAFQCVLGSLSFLQGFSNIKAPQM